MPFSAKVKETGVLFEAINLPGSTSVVYELEEGETYVGYLYPGCFDTAKDDRGDLIYRWSADRQDAVIEAHKLERFPTNITIKDRRGRKQE